MPDPCMAVDLMRSIQSTGAGTFGGKGPLSFRALVLFSRCHEKRGMVGLLLVNVYESLRYLYHHF